MGIQTARGAEMPQISAMASMQQLTQEHSLYERRLATLSEKHYLSEQEQMEEVQLKKWKLRLKDEMERLRRSGQAQHSM